MGALFLFMLNIVLDYIDTVVQVVEVYIQI